MPEIPVEPPMEKPFLARLSIAVFGLVMGIGGLGNAWSLAHQIFGAPVIIAQALLILAGGIFVLLVIGHTAKLGFHLSAVVEEFIHPIRSSFFPACSVAAL